MKSLNGEERAVLPEYQELAEKPRILLAGFLLMELILIIQSCRHFGTGILSSSKFYGRIFLWGVPFVGSGDIEAENEDIFIYGHNMRNGTMFADLLKYQSIEFWKMHPIIRLDTLWARYQYEIFTVLYADENDWENETDALFS